MIRNSPGLLKQAGPSVGRAAARCGHLEAVVRAEKRVEQFGDRLEKVVDTLVAVSHKAPGEKSRHRMIEVGDRVVVRLHRIQMRRAAELQTAWLAVKECQDGRCRLGIQLKQGTEMGWCEVAGAVRAVLDEVGR